VAQAFQAKGLMAVKADLHTTQVAEVEPVVQVLIVQINQTVVQEYITIFQEQVIIGPAVEVVAHTVLVQAAMVALVEEVEVL
jgi:hypothetical protein